MASNANHRYDLVDSDYDEDAALDISFVPQNELLCDDVLPFGWYRFLTYGMSRDMATSCPGNFLYGLDICSPNMNYPAV